MVAEWGNKEGLVETVLAALSADERAWVTKSEHQLAARLRDLVSQVTGTVDVSERSNAMEKLMTGLTLMRGCHLDRGGLGSEQLVRQALVMTFTDADWQRVRSSSHPLLVRVCELVMLYVEGRFEGDEVRLFDHLINGTYYAHREGLLVADDDEVSETLAPDVAAWWDSTGQFDTVRARRLG